MFAIPSLTPHRLVTPLLWNLCPKFRTLFTFHFNPLQNTSHVKSSFNSKTPASLTGIRTSLPYFLFLIQRRCLCCRDPLSSPYLPAQVICPLLDSWRQRFLSFFECFSPLCATAQQPLVVCHIHRSSSQASFDEKPERIESTTVQFVFWPSLHLSQCLWLPKRVSVNKYHVLLQAKIGRKIPIYVACLPRTTIPCQPLENTPNSHFISDGFQYKNEKMSRSSRACATS